MLLETQPWTLISCLKKRNRKSIHAFFPHTMQCVYVAYLPEKKKKTVTLLNFVVCMWIICIKKQTKNTQKRIVFRLCSVHVAYLRKTNKQTNKQNKTAMFLNFVVCMWFICIKKTNQNKTNTKTKHKTKQNKTKKYINKQKTAMFSNFVVCMWPIFIKNT